jgi:hypothetical protein
MPSRVSMSCLWDTPELTGVAQLAGLVNRPSNIDVVRLSASSELVYVVL